MADDNARLIDFDLGVEILRGPAAALEMHARRTKLALDSMPDPYAAARPLDLDVIDAFLAEPLAPRFEALKALFDPPAEVDDHPLPGRLVSEVYEF